LLIFSLLFHAFLNLVLIQKRPFFFIINILKRDTKNDGLKTLPLPFFRCFFHLVFYGILTYQLLIIIAASTAKIIDIIDILYPLTQIHGRIQVLAAALGCLSISVDVLGGLSIAHTHPAPPIASLVAEVPL
jgi:hypothetical protein